MAAITKEQVEEYYEKNKNDFKFAEAAPPAGGEAKPADQQPAPDEAKKVESEPAAKQPPADTPAAKEEAKEEEVELKLDAPASNDSPKPDGESKQSRHSPRQGDGAVAFVSYNAEDSAPPPTEPAAQPAAGDAPAAAPEKEPVPEAKTEAVPEPAAKAETPPEASRQAAAPGSAARRGRQRDCQGARQGKEPKEPAKEAPAASGEPAVTYKPLSEVEQEIRRNLARAPRRTRSTRR